MDLPRRYRYEKSVRLLSFAASAAGAALFRLQAGAGADNKSAGEPGGFRPSRFPGGIPEPLLDYAPGGGRRRVKSLLWAGYLAGLLLRPHTGSAGPVEARAGHDPVPRKPAHPNRVRGGGTPGHGLPEAAESR